jgi:arginyl-tRNA synthetase
VLSAEEETKKRRLKLIEMFVEVSNDGLKLLGIEPLERM